MNSKKMMPFFVFLATFFVGVAAASAYTVYMPHITGDSYNWTDYLQVDNDSLSEASFEMILYGSGGDILHQDSYSVDALSERLFYVKDYAALAKTGIITYDNERLKFRLSYQNTAGGVAEFRLEDTLNSDIGLYFSSSEVLHDISGKGAAIANMSDTSANVTLYAIGSGSIIDSYSTTIQPRSQIVGVVGSSWFSSVSAADIKKIVAVEDSGSNCLTGIVICTNTDLSKLLFTPSAPVTDFNTSSEYDMYEYFPFKSGNEWTVDSGDKLIITHNTESFPHISKEAIETYWFEGSVEPVFMYKDSNGYYIAATKDYDDPEYDEIFDPPLKYLKRYYSMGEEHTTQTGGITFNIKLESKENIETPAGVFENCLKFVYDISDSGGGTYQEIVWFAKNVGPVKIERPFEDPEGTYDGCFWSSEWAFNSNDNVIDRTTYLLDYDVTH